MSKFKNLITVLYLFILTFFSAYP